jgi:hypothetical protein
MSVATSTGYYCCKAAFATEVIFATEEELTHRVRDGLQDRDAAVI